MNRKLFAVLCVLTLVCCCFGAVAYAEDGDKPTAPTVYADDVSATVGGGVYVYVYAKDFTDVAGLDLYLHYDKDVFTFGSYGKGSLIDGTVCDVNAQTSGQVSLSMVSVKGIGGDGLLMYVLLYVKSDVAVGSYRVDVAVGDVYDSGLTALQVAASGCSVQVNAAPVVTESVGFFAECTANGKTLRKGDVFAVTYGTYDSKHFASGNFEVNFDNKLLQLTSAKLGDGLTSANGALYSVNTDVDGYVKATFAALEGVDSYIYNVFTVEFTVVGDVTTQTEIDFVASGLFDSALTAFNGDKCASVVTTEQIPPIVVVPRVFVRSIATSAHTFDVELIAEDGCNIAAGDFLVSFDSRLYTCSSIVGVTDGAMVVGNPNFGQGVARFSFILEDGTQGETVLAKLTFSTSAECGAVGSFALEGRNVTDKNYGGLTLRYEGGNVKLLHCFDEQFTVDKQPTCTEKGSKSKHCAYCDVVSDVTEIAALGHDLGDWQQTKQPTCTNDGEERKYCSRCDHYETRTVAALGHDVVHHEAKQATCTEIGWNAYDTCARCEKLNTYEEIPAKGHVEVVDKAVDPTCTQTGLTEGKHCSVCNKILIEQQTLAALGHNDGAAVTENKVEPTCATDGHYDSVVYCTRCNAELSRKQVTLPKLGHNMGDWQQTKQPTCTEKGEERKYCSRCDHYESRDIAALGHDVVHHEAKQATCTEIGWNAYDTCARCEELNTYKEIPAKGHVEVVDKAVNPTCTQKGLTEGKHCSVCNKILVAQQTLAALGHVESDWITDEPSTCTQSGSRHKECKTCHETLATETIAATGHSYGEWTTTVTPTTEADGKQMRTCTKCGHVEERTIDKVPKLGCFGVVSLSSISVTLAVLVSAAFVASKRRK